MDPLMKIPPYLTREEHEVSSKNDEQNSAEVTSVAELRTPDEWCRIRGVQVLDPDGWRGSNGRPWADPISLAEFQERLVSCTQRSVAPRPAIPHRRHVLTLKLEGDDPQALLSAIASIEYDLLVKERDHDWSQAVDITSGGYDSGWHLNITSDLGVDGEAYRASLKTWSDQNRAARKAGKA